MAATYKAHIRWIDSDVDPGNLRPAVLMHPLEYLLTAVRRAAFVVFFELSLPHSRFISWTLHIGHSASHIIIHGEQQLGQPLVLRCYPIELFHGHDALHIQNSVSNSVTCITPFLIDWMERD